MGGAEGSPIWQAYNVGRWWENKIFLLVSTSHDDLSNVNKLGLSWAGPGVGLWCSSCSSSGYSGHNHVLNTNIPKIKPAEGCTVLIKGSRPIFQLFQLSYFHRLHLGCNDLNKVEDIHRILAGSRTSEKSLLWFYATQRVYKSLSGYCNLKLLNRAFFFLFPKEKSMFLNCNFRLVTFESQKYLFLWLRVPRMLCSENWSWPT